LANSDLLTALWHLSLYRDEETDSLRRVNYAALNVEELGSVYESLLDFHPVVREEGGLLLFELVPGQERKSTGSYYTHPELVQELVKSALEPVLEERLSQASTPEEKGRAILSIKVCDPASGSGHFLLAAARRLGKELARVRTGEPEPSPEAFRTAVREVIAHCIYGVDLNPLAVDLCKVALWIESHTPGRPLTFLDHRIKCGNSLIGVFDLEALGEGIPDDAYKPVTGDDKDTAKALKRQNRNERKAWQAGQYHLFGDDLRELAGKFATLEKLGDSTPEEIRRKEELYLQLMRDPRFQRDRTACNLWTSAFFAELTAENRGKVPTSEALRRYLAGNPIDPRIIAYAEALAERHRFFHWPLEFPDVFAQGGFDVVLGNPPFMGGYRIPIAFGPMYRQYLISTFFPASGLQTDLCAYFYRRAFDLLREGGHLGMVATNTIGQGDTREGGLAVIVRNGGTITFARRFIKWPGVANVEVNLLAIRKGPWRGSCYLDREPVSFISSRLDEEPEVEPKKIPMNKGKAFIGSRVRGMGFVLKPEEAETLIARNPRNRDCLFPYLNGKDLNTDPEQRPSRWVICFFDWPLEKAMQYPDLLRIVEERVKPERKKVRQAKDRENWWLFQDYRRGEAIAPLRRVLVRSRVSEMHALVFVPKGWIYNEQTVVFAFDDDYHFALMQSSVHEVWLRKQASSLRTDVRYTPTDCFDTFPFPPEEYQRIANGEWRIEDLSGPFAEAMRIGAEYHEHRRQIMLDRNLGLTKTYHLFHDPECKDADIRRLRELHAEMDHAVLACYGWEDLDPEHGFYPNERGQTRFTVSPEARREILKRLLELNLSLSKQRGEA